MKFCAVHPYSRMEGYKRVRNDLSYIIFFDADEIIEYVRFKEYLSENGFKDYNEILCSNYY
ncbi:hypothetical protein SCALIN_C05_0083 [Candidatus Scalindua japonica]|uniref:Uncharacterized protein n=1 Tax=Candidatus Scalindua japonica TaxID=1284222 RepID=A0A286TVS3_9BACT|nr:hypothetical protein SCALIN_C05_0083 [Candidatus Scalindua japonica]